MKKPIKIAVISISAVAVSVIVAVSVYYSILFCSHFLMLESSKETSEYYSDFSIKKDEYTLKTKVLQDEEYGDILYFVVTDADNNTVFDSKKDSDALWRIRDFKSIEFSNDSLDIVVESGDDGTSVFRHNENGGWK